MMNQEEYKQAFNLAARVRKEANALDKLQNGALVGVFGAALALSLLFGGAWWALTSASGCIGLYRSITAYINYRSEKFETSLNHQKDVVEQLEYLKNCDLLEEHKSMLSNQLLAELNCGQEFGKEPILLEDKHNKPL